MTIESGAERLKFDDLHDPDFDYDSVELDSGVQILDRVYTMTVKKGARIFSRTETRYDQETIANTTSVIQHDDTDYDTDFTKRGNPTTVAVWVDPDPLYGDGPDYDDPDQLWLETTREFDDLGNVVSTTDPEGNETTFDYTDDWSGTTCGTGETHAFATTVTDALSFETTREYFRCSSLTASVTDPNSNTTSFTYDLLDRLKTVSNPDGGDHTRYYSDMEADRTATHDGDNVFHDQMNILPLRSKSFTEIEESNLNQVQTTLLDYLGRISLIGTSNGDDFDWVLAEYDDNGRRKKTSRL